MKKTLQEFKNFAIKGNAIDLAIGVVIGAAFGKIVSSLVSDIIMPPIGVLTGGVDFSSLAITLKTATEDAAAVTLNYGAFINNIIDFVIIAFSIFLVIRQVNRFNKKEEEKQKEKPKTPEDIIILREIRDNLAKK